nr:regulator of nonsense transcripts 1 homolog [Tanacetum cinerariifolium]
QGSHVQYNVADLSTQASQGGYAVDYATHPGSFLNHNSQAGFSRFGAGNDFMSQDYMGHGSQGLFTQVGFKDPSQDESSQSHYSGAAATSLNTQVVMNPLYSEPFTHYNSQPLNVPPQQQQQAPGQTSHYNG